MAAFPVTSPVLYSWQELTANAFDSKTHELNKWMRIVNNYDEQKTLYGKVYRAGYGEFREFKLVDEGEFMTLEVYYKSPEGSITLNRGYKITLTSR